MQLKRVVITGMGAISPYGKGCNVLFDALSSGRSCVRYHEELDAFPEMGSRIAGIISDMDIMKVPRKHKRSMSPMSIYALLAAHEAVAQAGLDEERLIGGRTGIVIGSTMGSARTLEEFFGQYFSETRLSQIKSMTFFRVMGHSAAANVAQALGITGRVFAPASACSTSCQAIGMAYETIALGKQDAIICGGTDEYHPFTTGTFDLLLAASTGYNATPSRAPRPFDKDRDGIVCAEGAGVLVLESLESALARGAAIMAEVSGFASTSDSSNIANPDPLPLYRCMQLALHDAGKKPEDVSYVNAHATATIQGDIAEGQAIAMLVGKVTPVSSLKGHMGHTMAASGVLESIACVKMLQHAVLLPTLNLETLDEACGTINALQTKVDQPVSLIVKNSFALGGINCSLVLQAYEE